MRIRWSPASSVAIESAISKIESGQIDVAIVIGFEIMKYVDSKIGGDILGKAAYYELEGKGIDLPFPKLFGRLADAILDKYPQIEEVENVKKLLADFKSNIKTTLKDDYKVASLTSPVKTDNDTIRLLLQKLGSYSRNEQKVVKVESP